MSADDQGAAVDHDDAVRDLCDLGQQVARHEHRPATCRELPQEDTEPCDPGGVQAVRRFVQDQDVGLAEERRGEGEPLLHPEREPANARVGELRHPGLLEHGAGPGRIELGLHARDAQVIRGGAARMEPGCLERGADGAEGIDERRIRLALDPRHALRRPSKSQHDPHRRRLARAVRTEESGDAATRDREREIVHRRDGAESLGDADDLDRGHHGVLRAHRGTAYPAPTTMLRSMTLLRIGDLPDELVAPVLIVAFDGWVDAAGASSGAAEFLADGAARIVTFDDDILFDYRSVGRRSTSSTARSIGCSGRRSRSITARSTAATC